MLRVGCFRSMLGEHSAQGEPLVLHTAATADSYCYCCLLSADCCYCCYCWPQGALGGAPASDGDMMLARMLQAADALNAALTQVRHCF